MARPTFGAISDLADLKGRRRALNALRRALPELSDQQRQALVWRSLARRRQCLKQERRLQQERRRQSPVEFCRGLSFEGWENLHNASAEAFFLLAPLGSPEVAAHVLELYHPGRERHALVPEPTLPVSSLPASTIDVPLFRQPLSWATHPARQALENATPAIWTLAIPENRGQWKICFQPPIPPLSGDTARSLTERYLSVLEEAIRCHPDSWPWRELG